MPWYNPFSWGRKGDAPSDGGGDDTVSDALMYKGPIPPGAQGLTDLARGMQHVALCTQDILGQHFVNVFNHYVDPKTREANEVRIKLPDGRVMDVPLIALIPPTTLALKMLKIKMAVAVNAVEVKATRYDKGMREVDRSRFAVTFGPSDAGNDKRKRGNQKMMDLEMTFESHDVPEAVHKVIDYFTQFVEPQDIGEANKYGTPKNGGDDYDHDGQADTPTTTEDIQSPPDTAPVIDADEPLHEAPSRSWADGPDRDPNAATPDDPSPVDVTPATTDPDDDITLHDTQRLPKIDPDDDSDDTVS